MELQGIRDNLIAHEQARSVLSKVLGFFTFVNIVWSVSIVGITVSVGPTVYHLLRPLRNLIKRTLKWLWRRVIQPLLERLHDWGVFELVRSSIFFCCRASKQRGFVIRRG